ncbi:MAG: glutamate-5-semialdehyde dehydrogenase [Oligoflexia bacterium]|nr:glutamate-5-semialdehyde dehydrogenase [Oligoflexia bacterium]
MIEQLDRIRTAARKLSAAPSDAKNEVLRSAARALQARAPEILAANAVDLKALEATPAFIDRLTLNNERIAQMAQSLSAVAALPDPVGEIAESRTLPNGLQVRRVRSPLGVIFMIFEARPNVAIEAFSLGFKSGNAMILRGGSESRHTTSVLYSILRDALGTAYQEALWGITDPDRGVVDFLLKQDQHIDVVVPRGGPSLIDHVTSNSKIPVIKNDRGLCHVYVHEDADLAMAKRIVVNAKTQRPGVCNSMETLLVHASVAAAFLPELHRELEAHSVTWYGCRRTLTLLGRKPRVEPATESSWDTEYLDYKINCRIVDSLDGALEHIARHGSRHSESIVTSSVAAARRFQGEVDAAVAYWNASTRFTDGFELGLGAELGISTQKLHVRGPVGLRELTSLRWLIDGNGQTRN